MSTSILSRRVVVVVTLFVPLSAAEAAAFGGDVKIVTKEGRASGTNTNAMEQAKQDALRRAVEEACGAFISGMTKTKNYQAVYDKAMQFTVGYCESFEVVSSRVEGGVSYCTVRANVSTQSFEQEWARLAHTIEAEGNPRCVVIVFEDADVDNRLIKPKPGGVVQSVLENFFLDKGVQLMDKGAIDDVKQRDLNLAALKDDVNKLAAMAAAFKADVVIKGSADARKAGSTQISGKTIYKWSATINVRAFHTDSAQMLMSDSYTATHSTVNYNAGGNEALRRCAEQHAANILRDVGDAWRQRQNVRRICQLTLENCTRADYKAFATALMQIDGVQNVKLRELVSNTCQVEVDWSYDLETLVGRIEALKLPDMSLEITEQTHDRVTMHLIK